MDDTQKYLNQILKKRLGSVVNYGGSSKTANNVTRIPKQQQKAEKMPTVFRKKHQTVYIQGQHQGSHFQQAQTEYMSMKQGTKGKHNQLNDGYEMPEQKQTTSQRVEYMLISKRIQNHKEDELISPTVDVTNYRKTNIPVKSEINRNQSQYQYKSNFHTASSKQVSHLHSDRHASQTVRGHQAQHQNHQHSQSYDMGSKLSSNTDKSKRKRIFGLQ